MTMTDGLITAGLLAFAAAIVLANTYLLYRLKPFRPREKPTVPRIYE